MMSLKTILPLLLFCQFANGQATDKKNDGVKEEIKLLLQQLNQARLKHDRPALENIYAPEFVNVHSAGFIDDRQTTIDEIISTDSIRALPIPSLDNLLVYGDVAVLKTVIMSATGTINTNRLTNVFIYAKKDGHWQIIHGQGTPLQKERKTVMPESNVLKNYTGKYQRNPGEYIVIEEKEGFLLMTLTGRGIPPRKLMATSDTQFFDKLGSEYVFSKEENGPGIILTTRLTNGLESKWKK